MIPDNGKVLEIGMGMNYDHVIALFDKYDIYPTDRVINEKNPGVQWLDAHDFSTSPLTKKIDKWDAILACEILEHSKWPGRVVQQCYNHLKENGLLVVTVPFWYRIHESVPEDKDTTESDMYDYWRITDRGMALLFEAAGFREYYTTRAHRGNDHIFCPSYIFGWAKKTKGEPVVHTEWNYDIPENWLDEWKALEEKYMRRLKKNG
jgi:2-polyprenyl-3-methyl-5-hydroxy-6-metoxy-1,4-benzoquinol methylase